MEKIKNIKTFITNHPDEVIGYYGHGSNSVLGVSMQVSFFAFVLCLTGSYAAIPFVAFALFAWYKVFTKNIYFVINEDGIATQSGFGFFRRVYSWSEIAAFHFVVKIVYYNRGGSDVLNRIIFKKKDDGKDLILLLDGMEKRFDEIHSKVERLTAKRNMLMAALWSFSEVIKRNFIFFAIADIFYIVLLSQMFGSADHSCLLILSRLHRDR